jgi:predicted RNA-binding Zn-ribbon protein involved in translation (DUF1610 family)
MPHEERDFLESPAENRPNKTSAVEVKFGAAVASFLEQLRLAPSEKIAVHRALIAVAWTSGALHDGDAFHRGGNDAGVKAPASTDVCFAPVNRSDDFPCPCVAGVCYNVILLDSRSRRRSSTGRCRSCAFPPDAALRGTESDAGEDRVIRRDGHGTSVVAGIRTRGAQALRCIRGEKQRRQP